MSSAAFRVSVEYLLEALHLPDGTKLIEANYPVEFRSHDTAYLVIWHPDIPDICPDNGLPVANPVFRVCEDGSVTLEDWGVE